MGQAVSHGGSLRPEEPLARRHGPEELLQPPAECPMHDKLGSSSRASLEALSLQAANNMPDLPQTRSSGQRSLLDVEREVSSIPRTRLPGSSDSGGKTCPVAAPDSAIMDPNRRWVYPSPQQFYNALVRKGKEAPEESVAMMVNIHNWLNETAWNEIRRWEETITGGETPELASFQGRPQDLSPKARWHLWLGKAFPDRYNTEPPFDRHDWRVWRPKSETEQRYIIDYYSAPDDEQGMPVFSLDVRPALDGPGAVYWRLRKWASDKLATAQ